MAGDSVAVIEMQIEFDGAPTAHLQTQSSVSTGSFDSAQFAIRQFEVVSGRGELIISSLLSFGSLLCAENTCPGTTKYTCAITS